MRNSAAGPMRSIASSSPPSPTAHHVHATSDTKSILILFIITPRQSGAAAVAAPGATRPRSAPVYARRRARRSGFPRRYDQTTLDPEATMIRLTRAPDLLLGQH